MIYALLTDLDMLVRFQEFPEDPPALHPAKGLRWVPFVDIPVNLTDLQSHGGFTDGLEDGEWVRRHFSRDKTYVERRMAVAPCYAPLPEQLDMQFKDAMDGGTRWVDHIAAVKAAHPKSGA